MTGHEPGSAHRDLDDLGNDELRIRGDRAKPKPA